MVIKRHKHPALIERKAQKLKDEIKTRSERFTDIEELVRMNNPQALPLSLIEYWRCLVALGSPDSNDLMYGDPPVTEAEQSDRILLTGTNVEVGAMGNIVLGAKAWNESLYAEHKRQLDREIESSKARYGERLLKGIATLNLDPAPQQYSFCSNVSQFWNGFFGIKGRFFMGSDKLTITRAIIGAGKMRYEVDYHDGTTSVMARLGVVADNWQIPMVLIDSWAP